METGTRFVARLKQWIRAIFDQLGMLWLALRDPRVPLVAKALAFVTIAYAVSPIDLIPDFIPVLGQLDDLIIVPLGVMLSMRLIAPAVRQDLRALMADNRGHPSMRAGAAMGVVVTSWTLILLYFLWSLGGITAIGSVI